MTTKVLGDKGAEVDGLVGALVSARSDLVEQNGGAALFVAFATLHLDVVNDAV